MMGFGFTGLLRLLAIVVVVATVRRGERTEGVP